MSIWFGLESWLERRRQWEGMDVSARCNRQLRRVGTCAQERVESLRCGWVACNESGDMHLEVKCKDNRLEKLCTSDREMRRKRPDLRKKLRVRINALNVADTLGDLTAVDPGRAMACVDRRPVRRALGW